MTIITSAAVLDEDGDIIIDGITVDADSGDVTFTFYPEDEEDGTSVTMPRAIFDELVEAVREL